MELLKKCRRCGKVIKGKRADAKYCSDNCRKFAYENRKLEGQFTASAKLLGHGYYDNNKKVINAGLADKEWLLKQPKFQDKEKVFDRITTQTFVLNVIKEVIEVVFQFFEKKELDIDEVNELLDLVKANLVLNDDDFSELPHEIQHFVSFLTDKIKEMAIATRLSLNKTHKIADSGEVLQDLIRFYNKYCYNI